MKIGLLNALVMTTEGTFRNREISEHDVRELLSGAEIDSAIGHPATAEILETLLGVAVPVSRQLFCQKVGQQAIVFKLNGRPESGKELSREELEGVGFSFRLMERIA